MSDIISSLRGSKADEAIHDNTHPLTLSAREGEIDCHEVANATSRNDDKVQEKAQKIFEELKAFAQEKGNHQFLNFYGKNALRARNFVGLIQTKSGFCVEILPKIFNADLEKSQENPQESKIAKIDKNQFELKMKAFANEIFQQNKTPQNAEKRDMRGNILDEISGLCEVSEEIEVEPSLTKRGEALPEISLKDNAPQASRAKAVLLNCLATLKDSPFKQSHLSDLKAQHFPLLEVFILMFLNEVERLIKMGIKSDYIEISKNRTFLKGKLLFNQNLTYNFVHKERFFTVSDEFSQNIAPNRLISATLEILSKQNLSATTSAKLNQARFIFSDIPPSQNITKDFRKCANSRHLREYKIILQWCEIFLGRRSFTAYSGDSKAFVLLFDMNKLFESFVAYHLKRRVNVDFKDYDITTQSTQKYLISCSQKGDLFTLKPDILITKKTKLPRTANNARSDDYPQYEKILILDNKWKILHNSDEKNGISQSDLYQIYAYSSKYAMDLQCADSNANKELKTMLIYPKCEATEKLEKEWENKIWYFKASKRQTNQPQNIESNPPINPQNNIESNNQDSINQIYEISLKLVFFPLE